MLRRLFFRFIAQAMRVRRPPCPACGEPITLRYVSELREPWNTTQHCQCGWAGSMMMLRPGKMPISLPTQVPESGSSTSDPTTHDTDRGYTVDQDEEGTREYAIPASGKTRGAMFVAILWCTLSTPFVILCLLGKMKSDLPPIEDFLSATLLPAMCLPLLYIALRLKYATHRLVITRDHVILERRLFGKRKLYALSRASIRAVEQRTFYTQNYQPVYGIEIWGVEGKLRFGSEMAEPDKAALCADLSKLLIEPNTTTASVPTSNDPGVVVESPSSVLRRSVSDGVVMLEWKNKGPGCAMAFPIVVSLLFAPFIQKWLRVLEHFSGVGAVIFILCSLPILVWMAWNVFRALIHGWQHGLVIQRIEARASGIKHSVYCRGRLVEETHFAPEEILSCRALRWRSRARENGNQNWRVKVVTKERILSFGEGAEKWEIERAAADLRRVLGQKPPSSAERP